MAVFRVEKNKGYTVMSNHHLRNRELSLKAKGLLSQMLSLPEDWDYTLTGLSCINTEKIDAIRTAVKELENAGYIQRERARDNKGRLRGTDYVIYEKPQPKLDFPMLDKPTLGKPTLEKPTLDKPTLENPTQLNIDVLNKELSTTDVLNKDSFLHSERSPPDTVTDGTTEDLREKIKKQIDYEIIVMPRTRAQIDEFVELILEVYLTRGKDIKLGKEEVYPAAFVRERFSKLDATHIEKVLEGIDANKTKVRNTKAYLMKSLFNAPASIDNHYTMQVNHDLYSS